MNKELNVNDIYFEPEYSGFFKIKKKPDDFSQFWESEHFTPDGKVYTKLSTHQAFCDITLHKIVIPGENRNEL